MDDLDQKLISASRNLLGNHGKANLLTELKKAGKFNEKEPLASWSGVAKALTDWPAMPAKDTELEKACVAALDKAHKNLQEDGGKCDRADLSVLLAALRKMGAMLDGSKEKGKTLLAETGSPHTSIWGVVENAIEIKGLTDGVEAKEFAKLTTESLSQVSSKLKQVGANIESTNAAIKKATKGAYNLLLRVFQKAWDLLDSFISAGVEGRETAWRCFQKELAKNPALSLHQKVASSHNWAVVAGKLKELLCPEKAEERGNAKALLKAQWRDMSNCRADLERFLVTWLGANAGKEKMKNKLDETHMDLDKNVKIATIECGLALACLYQEDEKAVATLADAESKMSGLNVEEGGILQQLWQKKLSRAAEAQAAIHKKEKEKEKDKSERKRKGEKGDEPPSEQKPKKSAAAQSAKTPVEKENGKRSAENVDNSHTKRNKSGRRRQSRGQPGR